MRHPTLQLKNTHLAMRRVIEQAVAPFGLTAAQFDVLQQLLHEDGLEHRVLQRRLALASPTLTNILDGMEASGHVRRRTDDDDRRVKRIHLSPSSLEMIRTPEFRAAGQAMVSRMFAGFTDDERLAALAMLRRIEANLERQIAGS